MSEKRFTVYLVSRDETAIRLGEVWATSYEEAVEEAVYRFRYSASRLVLE